MEKKYKKYKMKYTELQKKLNQIGGSNTPSSIPKYKINQQIYIIANGRREFKSSGTIKRVYHNTTTYDIQRDDSTDQEYHILEKNIQDNLKSPSSIQSTSKFSSRQ